RRRRPSSARALAQSCWSVEAAERSARAWRMSGRGRATRPSRRASSSRNTAAWSRTRGLAPRARTSAAGSLPTTPRCHCRCPSRRGTRWGGRAASASASTRRSAASRPAAASGAGAASSRSDERSRKPTSRTPTGLDCWPASLRWLRRVWEDPAMIFQQILNEETGCLSYLIGCGQAGRAVVVDPGRDRVDEYVALARRKSLAISDVLETHVHADHVSGAQALAAKSGASIRIHPSAEVAYSNTPVENGDDLVIGSVSLKILHTPGHTPDSIAVLVTDLSRGTDPWFVLTGDT